MPGFPPADELYYENPSIRIGGSIAKQLEAKGMNTLSIAPGDGDPFFPIPLHEFETLDELVDHLGERDDETTYYRGQTGRHEARYEGRIDRIRPVLPASGPFTVRFESLMPSMFREAPGTDRPDWTSHDVPAPLDQIAGGVRAIMDSEHDPLRDLLASYLKDAATDPSHLIRRLLQREGDASVAVPADSTAGHTLIHDSLHKLISIAQHYEFTSSMIDVTSSVGAATWFASHHWDSRLAEGDNEGVIYRFDGDRINELLQTELKNESPVGEQIMVSDFFGIVDIGDLDPALGRRPRAQSGGSLYGMANSIVYALFSAYDVMDAYTFPHDSTTGSESAHDKDTLCPPDDPVASVLDPGEVDHGPISSDDLDEFLREEEFGNEERERLLRAKDAGLL